MPLKLTTTWGGFVIAAIAALLVACSPPPPDQSRPALKPLANSPGVTEQSRAEDLARIEVNRDVYVYSLRGVTEDIWRKPSKLQAVATPTGVVWAPPQPVIFDGRGRPNGPATIYLTPYRPGGGDLSVGAKEILRLPLLERDGQFDVYTLLGGLFDAGDWVVTAAGRMYWGAETVSTRIDAVNVVTGATRFVTYGKGSGGKYFKFRVEPGRVFWEQRHWSRSSSFALDESAVMDLATGEKRNVPPAPGGDPSTY
jgi:hypothetical protein